jgi:hypothetical protein
MLLMIASYQSFTQDSLRRVPVEAWRLSRLIDDARLSRTCDSTLNAYMDALLKSQIATSTLDSLLKEVTISRDTWKYTSEQKDTLATVNNQKHDLQLKDHKRKTMKVAIIAISEAILLIVLLL